MAAERWLGLAARFLPGAVLLGAGVLKGILAVRNPVLALGPWPVPAAAVGVVAGVECLLGLALWVGLRPARDGALGLYAGFLGVALALGATGHERCGCLGALPTSPMLMLSIDAVCIALLLAWRPASAADRWIWRLPAAVAPVIGVALLVWLPRPPAPAAQPVAVLSASDVVAAAVSPRLSQGRFILCCYRLNCTHCRQQIVWWTARARQAALRRQQPQWVFINLDAPGHDLLADQAGGDLRILSAPDSFVQTPLFIALAGGRAVSHAATPDALSFTQQVTTP
jgi:hypothetical protein